MTTETRFWRNWGLGVAAMILFIGGLIAITVAADRWSPFNAGSSPVSTATSTPTIAPTSTSTATPTPTPTNTPTPAPVVYRVTYYGLDFQGGLVYCGTDIYGPFDLNDPTTAASGDGGPPCHTRLRLCSEATCQLVTIKDACGGCGPYHLDLSQAAWEVLGQPTHVEAQLLQAANPPALSTHPAATLSGGDFAALPLPNGVTVRYDGCGPTWGCSLWYNYYDAAGLTIVLQPEEPYLKEVHERMHAHQHWAINGGAPLIPSDYDLESWYVSEQGASFMSAVGVPSPWPWSHSAINGIEAFAWVGAYWYLDPAKLRDDCPTCYEWARENLP